MKHLKFLAFIALAIFMASCDDENTEKFNEKFTLKQSNKVTNLSKGSSSVYAAEYTYDIDYVDGTMDITASGVKFSPFMPAITFVINDVEFTYSDKGININASSIVPEVNGEAMAQYTFTKITGQITTKEEPTENVAFVEFILNNQYSIVAYPTPLIFDQESQVIVEQSSNDSYKYVNEETTCKIIVNEETSTADIYVNKAQFAIKMPAMNMLFKDVAITATENGFTLSNDSLTPFIIGDTGAETPMPNYPITELQGTINDDVLQLKFVCSINAQGSSVAGISYKVSANSCLFSVEK